MVETPSPTSVEEASGYLHPLYAGSLAEFGTPRLLPRSGGWVLERTVEGFDYRDAMGCYPVFCCRDWSQLRRDLDALEGELVSVAMVTDPFGGYDAESLKETFGDVVAPFKQHFVVDLKRRPETFVHAHHRRNARKALGALRVEECARPVDFLDEWDALYRVLVERHGVGGIAAFSRESFAAQLRVPGVAAFRAVRDGATEGMLLWYVQGDVAYYHLGAYSERGYELRASFALFSEAIEHFARRGLHWLNLGGGAGASGGESGLSRFKQGWATETLTAYFCGRVLDREKYEEVWRAKNVPPTNYFPAYRLGEFR
ncbi:MAG TPA: GNAT family N-acetyltransferase [Pyrinomonadaceae bacterium]|nr:GNAT family N-acetyltransferase [Pyrinomonadaceae bacterium]